MNTLVNFPDKFERIKRLVAKEEPDLIAYYSSNSLSADIASEIVVELIGKKYQGELLKVLERDSSGNVKKITYNIPFLNGDDPFKFGTAKFSYNEQNHD